MKSHQRHKLSVLVPHPRYDMAVLPSGWEVPAEEVLNSRLGSDSEYTFPESEIAADPMKQKGSYWRFAYYVDVLKKCWACHRPFIFFAREQQFWYETLQFDTNYARCDRCPECRYQKRQLRETFHRYSVTIGRADLGDDEFLTLIQDTITLFNANILKDDLRLRQLRNQARQRLLGNDVVEMINQVIAKRKLVSVEPPNQP